MPTYRVPVLVWQDHGGGYCACAVEPWLGGEQGVGVADTASDALGQVKNYLNWRYKQERWLDAPDLLDTEVIHLTVQVRPQYAQGDRVYPCDEPIDVRVPCVCGRQRSGLRVCSIPTLDIAFHYHGSDESKRLIAEKVRHGLSGLTPRELSRRLPPNSVRLAEVSVRVVRRDEVKWEPDLPTLRVIAEPIGQAAFRKRFTAAWQREAELADLTHRLGKEKAHVALVGDHGVGKSTLLVAAVRALERKTPTDSTEETGTVAYRHRHWWTSAARLIAGMKYLGQWEERLEEAIAELSQIGGVLCVENLLDLVLHGGAEATDSLAAFMLPYLQSGELRLVGEATPDEMNACRRLLPGLADVLQVLEVPRLDPASARQALRQLAASGSQETKIAMAEQGVAEVYRLFERFQPYQAMPGRAAALVRKLFDKARDDGRTNITVTDVVARFVRETGLPERLLHDDQPLLVEDLFKQFTGEVIGQDEACRAAAELIATFKAGMNNPTRPIGSMLFCGPTGVGKTEMAKVVSRYLFGAGEKTDRLVRLDMSEYSAPWSAERLIAKDPRTPSDFISKVRRQPFVVVLLDEIEKAAAEVFDVLLGVLDEGRLTDRHGRTTTFQSAILIMTSNLGTSSRASVGFSDESASSHHAEVRSFFRPEFYNRIDAVVNFCPLAMDVCLAITRKELEAIGRREGLAKAELRLRFTDELVQHLARAGFDRRYGARPLQRTLEDQVVSNVSRYLVENPGLRDTEIRLDVDETNNVTIESTR